MRAAAAVLGLGLLLTAAGLGGCGEDDAGRSGGTRAPTASTTTPTSEIALDVVSDDGAGSRRVGRLTCRAGDPRASGALYDGQNPARVCALAHDIRVLLTTQPATDRMCTQIYGGPQTGHVTGTIDGEPVDRRFSRTNGCEVADFDRAAGLLAP